MKKTPYTKIFCMLLTLAILLTPIAAMAEEEMTGVEFSLSNQPESYRIVKSAGLDTSELYLNRIPYTPQLNPKGDIVMRNIDLASAQLATDMIAKYDVQHPNQPFDPEKYLTIVSGRGLRLTEKALPKTQEVYLKMLDGTYPIELRSNCTTDLADALAILQEELNMIDGGEELSSRITLITRNFNTSEKVFSERLFDIYMLLYNARAGIARGRLPQSLLSNDAIMKLISVYRNVLEKSGLKLEELEFWGNDAAWMAYAATYSESELILTAGGMFTLSDKKGKSGYTITVSCIWPEPPEPKRSSHDDEHESHSPEQPDLVDGEIPQ